MHTVFALLCFVVVIHWLIFPYPSGLLHWHCGNLTIAPVPAKQPWWIWINTSCEFIMNDCITTTKQNTTKPCAYFLGYTVSHHAAWMRSCVLFNSSSQWWCLCRLYLNQSPPGQNGHHFPNDIFKDISWMKFLYLESILKIPINNILTLLQIMAWRRSDDKPVSEPMLTQFTDAYMRH